MLQLGHQSSPDPAASSRRMYPNPQDLGGRIGAGPEAAHPDDVTVQLDDEELSAASDEARLDVGEVRKARARSG